MERFSVPWMPLRRDPCCEIPFMPENPLLPHAQLRTLLALTKRCTTLEAAAAGASGSKRPRGSVKRHASREAVLAATTLQLEPGDLLIAEPDDPAAGELAGARSGKKAHTSILPAAHCKGTSRLLLATAMAAALQETGTKRVALLFTQAGTTDSAWQAALAWSQERLLPLIFVCTDASGPAIFTAKVKTSPALLQWSHVSRLATKLKLPVLTVDGEDAVAMYRAAQEAILRARSGGGPAMLWAALPTAAELAGRSRTLRPVYRLAQYLRTRGVPII